MPSDNLLIVVIPALITGVLGYIVRPFIDDALAGKRDERRRVGAAIERSQRARDRARQGDIEHIEGLVDQVRSLAAGRDPFLGPGDDPLGTSSRDYFDYRVDGLAEIDDERGAQIASLIDAEDYGEALRALRIWRNDLRGR